MKLKLQNIPFCIFCTNLSLCDFLMPSVPLPLKICFDLSVILGQVVSESEADLQANFLIITLTQERLEILMGETNVHILHCCSYNK